MLRKYVHLDFRGGVSYITWSYKDGSLLATHKSSLDYFTQDAYLLGVF